jgi:NAD-dependent deacetylase
MELTVQRLEQIIASQKRVVVVTGAGTSTLSGIPDFVSVDSGWEGDIPREVAISKNYFHAYPKSFWKVYKKLFLPKVRAELAPSKAHTFLKKLEDFAEVEIYTQNVDGLHQAAGSTNVTEVHGNANTLTCVKCRNQVDVWDVYDSVVPICELCGKLLKPDVVLFGEKSPGYGKMFDALNGPGVLLMMGTSLNVAPVNQMPLQAAQFAPHLWRVYWDKTATAEQEPLFHHYVNTDFSELN